MKQRSFLLSYQRVSSSSSKLAAAMLNVQQNLTRKIQNPQPRSLQQKVVTTP